MNILQILPELNVGGVETGTLDLARHLVKLGHKAVVVSGGGQLVKALESCGAIHYQLPVHKKSLFTMIRMVPRLAEIIKQENIQIVHARSRIPAWIAYFAADKTRAVFITTCHGYYSRHFFSQVMGWAKRVIVLSNAIARHMIDDFGVPHERIRLVQRSVDLEKFKYISPDQKQFKEFNVGIIGRITPLKGHKFFIKAMARLIRNVPNLKIWIVGDAPASREAYKEELQVLVKRLGLWHCAEFLGTQRDIPEILSNLNLMVLATTTNEAFGRVVVEAQACGVPVIATEVGGVVDIIENEKTGLFVPPSDSERIAEAALRIYKDKNLARKLAENAYKKVKEKYNLDLMIKNTLDVYKDALSDFKILVIKLSSLGDVILSTAALKAIRQHYDRKGIQENARYKISVLVGEESKDVLLRCPLIDELLVADFKNKDKGFFGFLNLAGNLRKQNFDIVIDLQNNRKSHILSFLTAGRNRYGYDNRKFAFLLNHRIKDEQPPIDPLTHQFRVLRMLGIGLVDTSLSLWPSDGDELYIDDFIKSLWLSANQKMAGININASAKWATKSWPLTHIVKLCELLGARHIVAVITGTQNDFAKANELIKRARNAKIINACGKTSVNQLACLIKRCSVYISADSSPLHIAAAVGVPFIALFGPTDPRRHMPQAKNCILINKAMRCSPCYKSKCGEKKCMESITPDEVSEAVDKLLINPKS